MQISVYQATIIGGLFSIIGALVGALTTFYFTKEIVKHTEIERLKVRFKNIFVPELALLKKENGLTDSRVQEILSSSYMRYAEGIADIAIYLNPKDKDDLYKKWEDYCVVGGSIRFFNYKINEDGLAIFHTKINELIKFTDKLQ